uniref:Transposase n=1 Tax=Steinernema glaseri TaxID=37863 RepID=A0A1I7ZNF2_9BILA
MKESPFDKNLMKDLQFIAAVTSFAGWSRLCDSRRHRQTNSKIFVFLVAMNFLEMHYEGMKKTTKIMASFLEKKGIASIFPICKAESIVQRNFRTARRR